MTSLNNLLTEIKTSIYIELIENLYGKIDWNKFKEFQKDIKMNKDLIINNIKNIHNYDEGSAVERLKELKKETKNLIYILNNLLENQ